MKYSKGTTFPLETRLSITAMELYCWAKFRVYGAPEADENVVPPKNYRVYTVRTWKRAISHFMLNNQMQWNEAANIGNPTRSSLFARLIRNMSRFQTQRRGVASCVRRPLTLTEYEKLMTRYWKLENKELSLCAAAKLVVQFHLIGRSDDVAKFCLEDLSPCDQYPDYGFFGCLAWSKNVIEERDSPLQILFGAMDTRFCSQANLAVWLEYHFELNPEQNDFVFSYKGLTCPIRITEKFQNLMREEFSAPDCEKKKPGLLGTHSVRKYAVTFARGVGCSTVRIFSFFVRKVI